MIGRAALALAAALLASCAGRRLDAIDTRLSAIEAVETRRQAVVEAELARLGARLDALILELRLARAGADAEAVAARLDELAAQVDRLQDLGTGAAPPRRRAGPDPAVVYAVPLDGAPVVGAGDALVTIVRAYEYACPYCEKSRATMDDLLRRYGKDLRVVYRSFIVHPKVATLPAQAACAAHRQGKFVEMDEAIWTRAWPSRTFDQATLEQLAQDVGLDLDTFRADLSGACVAIVQDDNADMKKVGVTGTPAFFINGRFLSGAQPVESFATLIDEELALARQRVKNKKQRRSYYKTWVLGKGQPELRP